MHDDAPLLERLLEAWRATRDPAVEEAIVRVGQLAGRRRSFHPKYEGAALERRWHELAAQRASRDVAQLLAAPWSRDWRTLIARVEALAAFPPDPRIARKIAMIVQLYPGETGSHAQFHRAVTQVLTAAATPSLRPWLACLNVTSRNLTRAYAAVHATIDGILIGAADPALLAEARARTGDPAVLDGCWEAYLAQPDDGERLVLADALHDAGDPRGEYIHLARAIADGTATAEGHARAAQLLAGHQLDWTGPIPGVDHAKTRFERGFATTLVVSPTALEQTAGHRAWHSVEELEVTVASRFAVPSLDLAGALRGLPRLRRLTLGHVSADDAAALLDAPTRARVLALGVENGVPAPGQFPNLRVLNTWSSGEATVLARRAAELGLQAIVLRSYHLPAMAAARRVGPPVLRVVGVYAHGFRSASWWVAMYRDDDVVDVARGTSNELSALIPRLHDAGFRRIRVRVSAAGIGEVNHRFHHARVLARRQGLALDFVAEPIDLGAPA